MHGSALGEPASLVGQHGLYGTFVVRPPLWAQSPGHLLAGQAYVKAPSSQRSVVPSEIRSSHRCVVGYGRRRLTHPFAKEHS
jgi:hypothetical protein